MSQNQPAADEPPPNAALYEALPGLDPAGRRDAVLALIEGHPQHRLELPARDGARAMLNEIDLSRRAVEFRAATGPPWWDKQAQAPDFGRADLRGASLRRANFEGARLEQGDFAGADLAGAHFRAAVLAEANFEGAMLEEADFQGASLRFVRLQETIAEGARFARADLWGAQAAGAVLTGADLEGVTLEESDLQGADLRGANLRGAVLRRANLRGANLTGADLRGAVLTGAELEKALLREARLEELVLSHCRLGHVHLSDAWLDRTRLQSEQLGGALGEELAGEYELARRGYLALERNFEALGDPDAAGWAYRKKRRMQKGDARRRARAALRERRPGAALSWYLRFAGDQLVEWVCDYGESVPRVLGSLFAVYLLFALIYGLTGTVLRVEQTPGGPVKATTYDIGDLAIFSLTAMTAPGNPPDWLALANETAYVLSSAQALLSIFLTGLLGFVAGNRIRR